MHSIEEYATELYLNLAPARFVSRLISDDLGLGFAIVNALIVAFAFWCYFVPVRGGYRAAHAIAWGFAIVEAANGVAHIALAASAGGYFSGVATAPLLVIAAVGLAMSLRNDNPLTEPR
jgi:hypothetical protein